MAWAARQARGMVFLRHGRAEHRHDALVQNLTYRTTEAVHGIDHGLQNRQEMVVGIFGVLADDHVRLADDVGKKHGDYLALPIEAGQIPFHAMDGRVHEADLSRGGHTDMSDTKSPNMIVEDNGAANLVTDSSPSFAIGSTSHAKTRPNRTSFPKEGQCSARNLQTFPRHNFAVLVLSCDLFHTLTRTFDQKIPPRTRSAIA